MSPRLKSPTEAVHPHVGAQHHLTLEGLLAAMEKENLNAARAVAKARGPIAKAAKLIAASFEDGGRLIYVGAGTSGRLGVLDASECLPTFGSKPGQVMGLIAGGERALRSAVEGAEDDKRAARSDLKRIRLKPVDVVCGISASGRAPYVLEALKAARAANARTVFITCNPPAARATSVDIRIAVSTGPEVIAGSTRLKAGTATKLVLNALTTGAFTLLGRVHRGEMIGLQPKNQKLKARAVRIVARLTGLSPAKAARSLRAVGFQIDRVVPSNRVGAR